MAQFTFSTIPFPVQTESSQTATVTKRIRINKPELHNDFDAWNAKFAAGPVFAGTDVKAKDQIASDATENEDGVLIERFFDYRDAELRDELQSVLKAEDQDEATNIQDHTEEYEYEFVLPADWTGNLQALATKIHEYLLKGSLIDWYDSVGVSYSGDLSARVDELKNDITSALLPFCGRIHMQPFGPAYKFR